MDYQWYPGHMTKSIRQMQENMKLIDLVIEILDARIPVSSRNPDIDKLAQGKARMILMNKSDLADPELNSAWVNYFTEQGLNPVLTDARKNHSLKSLTPKIMEACKEKIERNKRRGIVNRPIRAMVAGIPNVGKSTFINSFTGTAAAKTGNKPGVTRGKQWIRLNKQVELLDTPGLLWPKFEDQTIGRNIALIGSMRDEILNTEELSLELIKLLAEQYPGSLNKRYGITEEGRPIDMLLSVASARGCLKKGGETDTEKAAVILLDEFRSGTIGRITLERP
ncbi:MAG: ribosome biogenesis GTPase YlqF [Lachnospiraceae bacterium]|nr:ribosome biogenesis GTPase YlqF [Lachnospiraceae bacterium]